MSFLQCSLLLSVLSYQLLAFAVAQNACVYSPERNGICKPYADCKELHDNLIFQNPACKANTFCCPNNLITPPPSNNINNLEPEVNPNDENPPLPDELIGKIWNDVPWIPASGPNVGNPQPNPNFDNIWNQKSPSEPEAQINPNIYPPWNQNEPINPPIDFSSIPAAGQNVGNPQPNPNFDNIWNQKSPSEPEAQINPNIYPPWNQNEPINPPIDFSRIPADGQNVGNPQPNPNFDNIWNHKPTSVSGTPENPNVGNLWGENEPINPSIDFQAIPVDPYRNDPWGIDKPKNPTIVLPMSIPLDSPEIQENQEDGNDPVNKENPIKPFENDSWFKNETISAPPVQENAIQTGPKPITTTTEAIPIFDEEFYRRLGLAFGNKYNIYNKQDVITAENDVEAQTVSVVIEEVSTNSTHFMSNLNQLGLHKLSLEKCGFVHFQNDPTQSNVEAHLLEFPWLALLRYDVEPKSINFSCGGSLITERWVLTAASCVRKNLIGVRLGEYEISEKSNRDCVQKSCTVCKDYKIANTVKHPEYKPETGFKDIALIKLKARAQKSKNIKTICLPTKVEYFNVPYNSTPLTVTGWGLNKAGATKVMKKHAINRRKLQVCQQANPAQLVHQSKLCIATRHEEPSTCSGDPGGPVSWIVDDNTEFVTQIGIVPFGMDKCGAADGVVSKYYVESVADSMDWITKVIGED